MANTASTQASTFLNILPARRSAPSTSGVLTTGIASVKGDARTCRICGWNLIKTAPAMITHAGNGYFCTNCAPVTDRNKPFPTLTLLGTK